MVEQNKLRCLKTVLPFRLYARACHRWNVSPLPVMVSIRTSPCNSMVTLTAPPDPLIIIIIEVINLSFHLPAI